MTEEYVYWVDENDNVLGKVTRKEMRAKKLLHRSVFIIVFNTKGDILIHRRTATKDIFPNYYAIFVGGTLTYGESYEQGAIRESEEEIGAKDAKLQFIFKYLFDDPKTTRVMFYVYKLLYDGPLRLQKEEVAWARFIPFSKLKEVMKKEKFCPDDIELFNKYLKEVHDKKRK